MRSASAWGGSDPATASTPSASRRSQAKGRSMQCTAPMPAQGGGSPGEVVHEGRRRGVESGLGGPHRRDTEPGIGGGTAVALAVVRRLLGLIGVDAVGVEAQPAQPSGQAVVVHVELAQGGDHLLAGGPDQQAQRIGGPVAEGVEQRGGDQLAVHHGTEHERPGASARGIVAVEV